MSVTTSLHIDTERGWRGGERQVLWLVEGLRRLGHRAILAARPGEPLAERAAERGIEVVACAPRTELDPFAAASLRRVVRHEGVQVVHAHTGHAVALAALAARRTGARMVLTRRVDFPLKRNVGARWKYRQANAIIAISRAIADVLVRSGIDRSRIAIVPSGVDLSRTFAAAEPGTVRALGVPDGAPLVVQVAALVQHKDPLTFVRAIAAARRAVPTLHALMVGEGALRPDVEREIAALGVADAVHLTGYRQDADALLAAADVVTLSSEEEGLGTVLIDALSIGKPVAATAGGGIPEVVEHEVSGLVVPVHDASALGAAIARILTDRDLAARLAAAGPPRAREFSVENTVRKTLAVYERMLRSGEPEAGSG